MEFVKKIESSEYGDGVVIQDYNGVFSIQSATLKGDNIYKRWVFPQDKDRCPLSKAIPMQVKLGTRQEAVDILEFFLDKLKKNLPAKVKNDEEALPPVADDDALTDIPF